MRGRSGWVLLIALLAAAGALLLAQAGNHLDSPEHSSNSDGRNGTSALRQYATALRGHRTSQLDLSFNPPPPPATLFVFNPTQHFSADDTTALVAWVKSGGTLVYGADQLDTRLALAFDLHQPQRQVPATGRPATPAFKGVETITTESFAHSLQPTTDQATLFASLPGGALVIEQALGRGRVITISAPEILCNGWLEKADNGRFAADLIAMTPGPVVFDEFHHGAGAGSKGSILGQPLGIGLMWASIAVFLGLLLRGRAFGPRIPVAAGRGRSAAEYATAVGHLLHQAGGRSLTLQVLGDATRRALAVRFGIGGEGLVGRLDEVLERRAPDLAGRYTEAMTRAGRATASDAALLEAARGLHDLAYPRARNPVAPKERQ